ncbi:uncharacterized protein G2W53_026813 [Senna tora]|uniref:Uncharacterized protein n=1 Tax=Senna tora TaxID=362788 RepID=A0A834WHS8_9FABA|nr:uncharacterized protein G2W53_026813 [Senna tora]
MPHPGRKYYKDDVYLTRIVNDDTSDWTQRKAPFREIKFSVACVALHCVRCSVTTEPMLFIPLPPSGFSLGCKILNSESGASLSLATSRGRDPKPQPSVYFLLASPSRSHLIASESFLLVI